MSRYVQMIQHYTSSKLALLFSSVLFKLRNLDACINCNYYFTRCSPVEGTILKKTCHVSFFKVSDFIQQNLISSLSGPYASLDILMAMLMFY